MKRFWIFCLTLLLSGVLAVGVCAGTPVEGQAQDGAVAEEADAPADEEGSSLGEVLCRVWEEHAGEIFSALTLFGSLILAYCYKRGLLPVIWGGLDSIAKASEAAGAAAKELAASTDESLREFCQQASPVFESVESICREAGALADRTREMEARIWESEDDRAMVKTLMRGVADMLYGIFTAANLPQYAKEQLGQRYAALTAALAESGGEERHNEQETAPV